MEKVEWESVRECVICGSESGFLRDERGNIRQCGGCGLRYVSPRPAQEYVEDMYDKMYVSDWNKIPAGHDYMYEENFRFVEKYCRKGRILDVGAGFGALLAKAKRNGWECRGTELSQQAIDYAKNNFGITLIKGQIEDIDFGNNEFEAVVMYHVLEHLPYPCRALRKIRGLLKPDGRLILAVPNDSWLGRRHFYKNELRKLINKLPLKRKLKLKKMYPEITEPGNIHLLYFTPRTLKRILDKEGFYVVKSTIDYHYDEPRPDLMRRYKRESLFCGLTGINISSTIRIVAGRK